MHLNNFIALILVLACFGCDREPGNPHAGQVVKPIWGGPGRGSNSSQPIRVSLYEYSDRGKNIITGQSIAFDIPAYFITSSDNQVGGPQIAIHIAFDPNGIKPHLLSQYPSRDDFERAEAELIDVSVLDHGHPPRVAQDEIEENGFYPPMIGLMLKHTLRKLDASYCGFDVFESSDGKHDRTEQIEDAALRDLKWPYAAPLVFAKPLASGDFSPVLTCSRSVFRDGFPRCGMDSSYHGWPLLSSFSAKELCNADKIVAQTTALLDRYRKRETIRSTGQIERRYKSAILQNPSKP